MSSWYNSSWTSRIPVAVNCLGGGGGSATVDISFTVPSKWSIFWDNIRVDGFDVILTSADGVLLSFKRNSYTHATKILELQVDNYLIDNDNSIQVIYMYWNNPASTDLSGSFTVAAPKTATVFVGGPSDKVVTETAMRAANDSPAAVFTKATNEKIFIFFQVASVMLRRPAAYQKRNFLEGIKYIIPDVKNAAGASVPAMHSTDETICMNGYVGLYIKEGSDNTDYIVICNVVTTLNQTLSLRCALKVRDLLPS